MLRAHQRYLRNPSVHLDGPPTWVDDPVRRWQVRLAHEDGWKLVDQSQFELPAR